MAGDAFRNRYFLRRVMRRATRPLRRLLTSRGIEPVRELFGDGAFRPWNAQRVVAVIAHPDDEVFCSGLLAGAAAAGARVSILCMTRGEGGDCPDDVAREDLGNVRAGEMEAATEALGAEGVAFLNYVDPVCEGGVILAPRHEAAELAAQILAELRRAEATVVVTHGSSGEYWHPAHVSVHDAVRRAVAQYAHARLLTMKANPGDPDQPLRNILNRDDPAAFRVDGAPFEETRLRSLACHSTQRGVFERFTGGGTLEEFVRATGREFYGEVSGGRAP